MIGVVLVQLYKSFHAFLKLNNLRRLRGYKNFYKKRIPRKLKGIVLLLSVHLGPSSKVMDAG